MGELGSLLTRQREARGLTVDDAERDTRISRRYLQALEAEQFDVIPAPVYARGFLRSYSQYLGLDPQEMLSMFPREGEPERQEVVEIIGAQPSHGRRTVVQPPSAVGPPQPVKRRPSPPAPKINPSKAESAKTPPKFTPREEPLAYPLEPTIGIDIGLPGPNRRIKSDPAAQTRSATVVVVAVAVLLFVVLLGFLIIRLGGGDGSGGGAVTTPTTRAGATTGARAPFPPNLTPAPVDGASTPGATQGAAGSTVPDVTKLNVNDARKKLTDLGYTVSEKHQKDQSAPKDTVIQQAPAPDFALERGKTVFIVISDGP